jgi:hypothetical protein
LKTRRFIKKGCASVIFFYTLASMALLQKHRGVIVGQSAQI